MQGKNIIRIIILSFMILSFSTMSYAKDASFSWLPNSETDLSGYKIYWSDKDLIDQLWIPSDSVDTGMPATVNGRVSFTVTDIPDNATYFAVTAYDTNNNESDFSDIVIYDPAPAIPQGLIVETTTTTTTTTTTVINGTN